METALLIALIVLVLMNLGFTLWLSRHLRPQTGQEQAVREALARLEKSQKDEFRLNREEVSKGSRDSREELGNGLKNVNDTLVKTSQITRDDLAKNFKTIQDSFAKNIESFNQHQQERFAGLESKQNILVESTEKKLEQMRETVDEKLQKTLNQRLTESFETVGKQLESVQLGLGEMKSLAQDVGGLKKVLSNVKMRGGIGEVQLSLLLESVLAPEQYVANVKTKPGSADHVEFAIKLPGKDTEIGHILLPIDAKFPKDIYEQLLAAYESGDLQAFESSQKNFETKIKVMAKDISEKYISPPHTTDFGIMFLPFEGIYAEVTRNATLLEELQTKYKVIVAGPTNLAALLNSLQVGFRTLAIQQRSGEVWKVLGEVKNEFDKFGGLLAKAQHNFQTGLKQLDDVMGTRTRAIQRKLKNVEIAPSSAAELIELSHEADDEELSGEA